MTTSVPIGDERSGGPADAGPDAVSAVRLDRHVLHLDDGHRVQIAVAGHGVPMVVVHGFTAEGFLYAQTLSRLVSSGFKVIAIDTAGSGGTEGLRKGAGNLSEYAALLGRVVDHLGIDKALYVGHSLGGRLVTELLAHEPERGIALVLLDAIVGDTWDAMVACFRFAPPLMGVTGGMLMLDALSTLPVLRDRNQARKLAKLWLPVLSHNVLSPLNLVGGAISILRSGPTRWMLEKLGDEGIPVVAIHGDRDLAVPLRTAREAAVRSRGQVVVVHGASHAWVLKDPETLPAIFSEMVLGRIGITIRAALADAGVDMASPSIEQIEAVFYAPDAAVHVLTPADPYRPEQVERRPPRYTWTWG